MKLLASNKSKITKDENGENEKITQAILFHCNILNNDYQQDSRVLYTFLLNKPFGQLLDISCKNGANFLNLLILYDFLIFFHV